MSNNQEMLNWPVKRYSFPMPISYHLSKAKAQSPGVVVCLHGFQDHALSMLRRIGWWENEDTIPFQVLAMNGPYPVPVWTGSSFVEAYSWYFRDAANSLNFVSPVITADRLVSLLTDLGLKETPKVLFGFSQGGILCPYLAAQLGEVRGVIGLGCGYKSEIYAQCKPMRVFAIHGANDERIAHGPAAVDFAGVLQAGHRGQFYLRENLTHRVEPSVEPLVRQLAMQCFTGGPA